MTTHDDSTARPSLADLLQEEAQDGPGTLELLTPLAIRWRSLIATLVLGGVAGFCIAWVIPPIYTAQTTFIPPQSQTASASAALAQLGALASISGGSAGPKNPADQFVSFMESETVRDRIIDRFGLMKLYGQEFRDKTREKLGKRTAISVGKKDGLVTVAVEDTDPKRAAAMANQYVDELRALTANLAVSEAQRRRVFFEAQMIAAKNNLIKAQVALQGSGFTSGALKAEPQAAADSYARLRAELTAAQVTLDTMRGSMTENTPEVKQLVNRVQALHDQLHIFEQSEVEPDKSPDYVSKYREFKYQEALFDMMARQYELARVDEARDGAMVQVVDPAHPPEHKTWPKRSIAALIGGFACLFLYAGWLLVRERMHVAMRDPKTAEEWANLRRLMSRA